MAVAAPVKIVFFITKFLPKIKKTAAKRALLPSDKQNIKIRMNSTPHYCDSKTDVI